VYPAGPEPIIRQLTFSAELLIASLFLGLPKLRFFDAIGSVELV
jgi:hypothetical protein